MSRPFFSLILVLLLLGSGRSPGGDYLQDFSGFAPATTDLGDGSEIGSNDGVAQVRGSGNPYLRLTSNNTGGTSSFFKLPVLDPDEAIISFTATFRLQVGGTGVLADGAALSYGAIPSDRGLGEGGFPVAKGLVVAWDTYANAGEVPSIEVFADGASVFNQPFDFSTIANEWVAVEVRWDEGGLDLRLDGAPILTGLELPGFEPSPGNRFAFTGRTGGARQSTYLDDLVFLTAIAPKIETGGPIISEFISDNENSHEDEDLEEPDWLEIYNGQDSAVTLEGYFLTTDPTHALKWRLPAVTLQPYGYRVVFASGKDRSLPGQPLHTDFTLLKAGGYLALIAPDESTVLSEYHYGPQVEDVAYGELGEERTRGFLETPTPGRRNAGEQGGGPPAEGVEFERRGGLFSDPFQLSILPPVSPTAEVRYTLDGRIPDEGSTLYAGPIAVTSTTTIRARVFEPGQLPGEVRSRTFLKLSAELRDFTSNLPVVVVDSGGVNIDADSDPLRPRPFRPVYTVVLDRESPDGLSRLDGIPDFTGRGGMHVRGQSSSGFPKKQYAWETWTNEDEDKDVSLLGMPAESDWILQAPYSDKTLMRNTLVYDWARQLNGNFGGVRTRFVEVFFNQSGGAISSDDYRGVYVLMEKIKRGRDRIDVEKLNDLVTSPDLITGGYIFKRDKPPHSQPWTTAREQVPLDMHYPEAPNGAQFDYLRGHLDEMEAVLHGSDFRDPDVGYSSYLDAPSFIDAHLFVETFKNIDGYRISTFFSKPRHGRIKALPIWDYNLALGNANYLQGSNPQGWYHDLTSDRDYYWYDRLFADREFALAYWDRFWELRRGVFSDAALLAAIEAQQRELEGEGGGPNAVTRNFERWNILGELVWPNPEEWDDLETYEDQIQWMKDWLTERMVWMEDQSSGTDGPARPPGFSRQGGEVATGDFLALFEANGWEGGDIYYTLDGSDPRVGTNEGTTLVAEGAPCEVLVPSVENGGADLELPQWTSPEAPPNSAEWLHGVQGVGYERSSNELYDPFLGLDVEAELAGNNRSCYIRLPFFIGSQDELDALTGLVLRMRYDDSFVAYLNGVEVVREANAPGSLDFQSGALGEHDDREAVRYLDFEADSGLPHLRVGGNVLAIHGLNNSLLSSDALWSAILRGTRGGANTPSATAMIYTDAIELTQSVEVKAREYDGQQWSPLARALFSTDTLPAAFGNLVVSELLYHPSPLTEAEVAAGFQSAEDFEYLELLNIDPVNAISLAGVSLIDGVEFAGFTDGLPVEALILPPGERLVVVQNEAAFRFRHRDPEMVVAGEYAGRLRNEGERLTLTAADGQVIQDFVYSPVFPWPVSAGDGRGDSLVLRNPESNPDHGDGLNWKPSVPVGGSPGDDDSIEFAGEALVDGDGDGLNALTEYAIGTSDEIRNTSPPLAFQIVETVPGVREALVEVQVNLQATGIEVILEKSGNLRDWSSGDGLVLVAREKGRDGLESRIYRSPGDGGRSEYFRLRIRQAR